MKYTVITLFFLLFQYHAFSANIPPVQVEKLAESTQSWNDSKLPAYPSGQPKVTILKITVAPHTTLPLHIHTGINAGVMLQGKLTVKTPKNDVLYLTAGDSIIEMVNQLHYGINESDEPAVILVFYAGVEGMPITVLHEL